MTFLDAAIPLAPRRLHSPRRVTFARRLKWRFVSRPGWHRGARARRRRAPDTRGADQRVPRGDAANTAHAAPGIKSLSVRRARYCPLTAASSNGLLSRPEAKLCGSVVVVMALGGVSAAGRERRLPLDEEMETM
jgi:hypothetical protein